MRRSPRNWLVRKQWALGTSGRRENSPEGSLQRRSQEALSAGARVGPRLPGGGLGRGGKVSFIFQKGIPDGKLLSEFSRKPEVRSALGTIGAERNYTILSGGKKVGFPGGLFWELEGYPLGGHGRGLD